jgi:hypothetical protein
MNEETIVARRITFLELDRGSGDTDGCDSEEYSEEHRHWRAKSGRRATEE